MLTVSVGNWRGNIASVTAACTTHHVAVRQRSISPAM